MKRRTVLIAVWSVVGGLSLVLLVALATRPGDDDPTPPSRATPEGTSAADLCAAYKDNPLAAKELYEGREILVWGKVARVKEQPGGAVVVLERRPGSVLGVQCRFAAKHNDRLALLRRGDLFSLRGRVVDYDPAEVFMDVCRPAD